MKAKNLQNILVVSSIALAALASGKTLADTGIAEIKNANPSPIIVVSNGTNYTQTSGSSELAIGGRLQYDSGTAGRIKSWEVWPVLKTGFGIEQEVANTKTFGRQSESYGIGKRPKMLNRMLIMKLPMSLVSSYAVSMCNLQASVLRDQGFSNTQIFGQDRTVHFNVTMGRTVDASGAGSNKQIWEYAPAHKLMVKCARHNSPSLPKPGATIQNTPKPPPGYQQNLQTPAKPQTSAHKQTLQAPVNLQAPASKQTLQGQQPTQQPLNDSRSRPTPQPLSE